MVEGDRFSTRSKKNQRRIAGGESLSAIQICTDPIDRRVDFARLRNPVHIRRSREEDLPGVIEEAQPHNTQESDTRGPRRHDLNAPDEVEEQEGREWQYKSKAPERPYRDCLLYTSDAADERSSVDLGG